MQDRYATMKVCFMAAAKTVLKDQEFDILPAVRAHSVDRGSELG